MTGDLQAYKLDYGTGNNPLLIGASTMTFRPARWKRVVCEVTIPS